MNKRKGFRLFTVLALCMVLVSSFSMTAFAYADDTDQNLPITEATQPEDMTDTTEPEDTSSVLSEREPIDDEGNAYTRDLLYDKATNKKIVKDLLDKGWCRVTGLYTPKKPQLYDAIIRLNDTGGKYVSFKIEFEK